MIVYAQLFKVRDRQSIATVTVDTGRCEDWEGWNIDVEPHRVQKLVSELYQVDDGLHTFEYENGCQAFYQYIKKNLLLFACI